MSRPVYRQKWAWVAGIDATPQEVVPDIESTSFALSNLADRGLLTTRQLADFQDMTGLADLAWQVSWSKSALLEADGDLRSLMRRTQGFVVFMHGWSANGDLWAQLPALTCAANPRLVALTPDLNGFGGSPFLSEVPTVEQCLPSAIMQTVSLWVQMLGLRSSRRAQRRHKVITFVGHSMGGAALFYLPHMQWRENEVACCAIAPTLLINNDLRASFFQALGMNSWATRPVDELKTRITRRVVEKMLGCVDESTLLEHVRIFESTSRGTLAQTFYAMGAAEMVESRSWQNVRVILAHDDHVLEVAQMLRLLDDLGLGPPNVRVVSGDHYLFAASDKNRRAHLQNRELVVGEILYLHESCREQQRV